MHIKICGLTNLDDARVALAAGADLLGFNFYPPSPRCVAPDVAADIIVALRVEFASRSFRCVGVFVNESRETMRAIQQQCMLDLLQLHGDETADDVFALAPYAFKVLRPKSAEEAEQWISTFTLCGASSTRRAARQRDTGHPPSPLLQGEGRLAPRFLIDTSHPNLYGGTGQTSDWSLARNIASRHPILLAGGLNPPNVADAIRAVRPWGVDVASGVERAPGVKDAEKVRRFIGNVKGET